MLPSFLKSRNLYLTLWINLKLRSAQLMVNIRQTIGPSKQNRPSFRVVCRCSSVWSRFSPQWPIMSYPFLFTRVYYSTCLRKNFSRPYGQKCFCHFLSYCVIFMARFFFWAKSRNQTRSINAGNFCHYRLPHPYNRVGDARFYHAFSRTLVWIFRKSPHTRFCIWRHPCLKQKTIQKVVFS